MDAILLVGGQGTRLRPLTISAPKPMLPTAGVPFTAHQLARAKAAGIDHVVLATSYQAEVFEAHFGDGSAFGLELEYVTEVLPLGTGGGIRNVADRLRSEDVVVLNGDVLDGHDIAAQVAMHRKTGAAVTLYLTRVDDPRAFGCVPVDEDGRVTAFLEKDPDPVTNLVNAGCYVFRRQTLLEIPAGEVVSVERQTFPGLLAAGDLLHGFIDDGYWLDLGTPAAFVRGSCDLVLGRVSSPALPGPTGEWLLLPGAQVAGDAKLSGGTTVGAGASVGAGARVHGSVVFDGAQVAAGAHVVDSVIGRDASIGAGTVLRGVVIGDRAVIGAGNELLAGARVFPGAVLGDGAVRFSSDRS
ncbi:MAG TPA: NDP-sugar synthase [Mycobacteriales bacterium]|nr:NDP-sugar synthase [Mycobacteriales bacterium]